MKIKCLTTFLDGAERFEQDDVRTVSDERGAAFVAAGWAEDVAGRVATGKPATGSADLDIDNVTKKQEANHG